jgi:dynein heavy chain
MRSMSRNIHPYTERHEQKWVVLDGDIDPNWIESLNTVMDDNKILTLVSNERIPLTPPMRMVFEISNLDNATPATVSRAGILYINAKVFKLFILFMFNYYYYYYCYYYYYYFISSAMIYS